MNIFNIAGASAEQTFNNLGGFKRLIQNNKFHDNLKVLLETKKGTLIGDPDFGSNLYQLLFEPANEVTANLIRQEVAYTIENYNDNIVVDKIDVTYKSHTIQLNPRYRVLNTNVADTIMLEFIRGDI